MAKILAIVVAALLTFVVASCGHKGPPTLKETGTTEKREAPPQRPSDELYPYSEDTSHLRKY
ncbi:MAG: hypothetical protein HQK99_02680 [Nitrospirae bacterium]|nr:hypothetical protein [Nitrospirota bacterium]